MRQNIGAQILGVPGKERYNVGAQWQGNRARNGVPENWLGGSEARRGKNHRNMPLSASMVHHTPNQLR